jgi:hypothetical protein
MDDNTRQPEEDARQHARVDVLYLITYVNSENDVQQTPISMGRALDISPAGVRMEVLEPVKIGSRMEVQIAIRETRLPIRGRVVRVTEEDGRYIVGMAFEKIQKELEDLS